MDWKEYCKTFIPNVVSAYQTRMGKPLNLNNPLTFTEKVQWLKIFDSVFLKTLCADKIMLHDYCTKTCGHDYCIPLIKTYDNARSIDFNALPNNVVFKCNHGSGYNIICNNLKSMNKHDIINRLNTWLAEDYSTKQGFELHYKLIPHKILVEPLLSDGPIALTDYKVYCFNGKIKFFQVIKNRGKSETMSHFTPDWTYAPEYDQIIYPSDPTIQKPSELNTISNLAQKLAKPFKMVRVDFYIIDGNVYLGELTFTPYSGYHEFVDNTTDKKLGDDLHI